MNFITLSIINTFDKTFPYLMRILFIVIILVSSELIAQDILVLSAGTEVACKLDSIGNEYIRYQTYFDGVAKDNSVKKSEVFLIIHRDGRRQIITPLKKIGEPKLQNARMSLLGGSLYLNNKKLTNKIIDSLFTATTNQDMNAMLTKGMAQYKRGSIFLYSSLPILAASGIGLLVSIISYNQAVDFINVAKTSYTKQEIIEPFQKQLNTSSTWIGATASIGTLALASATYGIVIQTNGRNKLKNILKKYNEK